MYESFGAVVTGSKVEFKLFFPNNTQFVKGGSPNIKEIRARGDFQSEIGGKDKGGEKVAMKIGKIEACLIVFFVVMLALMSITPVAMAITGQLRLSAIPGEYNEDESEDAWLSEGTIIDGITPFELTITNHNGPNIRHLYLLVAVDRDPAPDLVTVEVDNIVIYSSSSSGEYFFSDEDITESGKALVTTVNPYFEYPGHGIYNTGDTHFEVVEITIEGENDDDDDGILEPGETITVVIDVIPNSDEVIWVHFDAVGADKDGKPVAFVPPSEDATYVPEFSTVAIPVAAILGLFFFFNRRKRKKR